MGDKIREDCCLSIISTERTLDLQAPSSAVRDVWVKGLTSSYKRFVQDGMPEPALPQELEKAKSKVYPEKYKSHRSALRLCLHGVQSASDKAGRQTDPGAQGSSSRAKDK